MSVGICAYDQGHHGKIITVKSADAAAAAAAALVFKC